MDRLEKYCSEYFCMNLTPENALKILDIAVENSMGRLELEILKFILQ
jgi:hypothetical protein